MRNEGVMEQMNEITGNIHIHTTFSDGTGSYPEVIAAAARMGLDFIIVTDHNRAVFDEEGWRDDVLVLVGEEVNDVHDLQQQNHCLCLGTAEAVEQLASDAQALIDTTNRQDGVSFLAHPIEIASKYVSDVYPWTKWEVKRYTGVELWNYSSTFRPHAKSWAHLLGLLLCPDFFQTGPLPEMLSLWDRLLSEHAPVVAIGGSDCHAAPVRVGRVQRKFLSYEACFSGVNTHLLSTEPLSHSFAPDKRLVYQALAAGHAFVAFDRLALTNGFRFMARQGQNEVIMGDRLPAGATTFRVQLPQPAEIRLLCNGALVAQTHGTDLTYRSERSGVYRVEVYRRWMLRRRGWIFSNPIYVGVLS